MYAMSSFSLSVLMLKSSFVHSIKGGCFAAMNFNDDLQTRWWKLEEKLIERFEKEPDVETIMFLIGIQELGEVKAKFTKEQKQDLMHVAVCTVLMPSGYY